MKKFILSTILSYLICNVTLSNTVYDHVQAQSEADDIPQSVQFISTWLENYIGKPNLEQKLPYKRSICPFVPRATAKNLAYYVEIPEINVSQDDLINKIRELMEIYKNKEPIDEKKAIFKTLLIILPNLSEEDSENLILDVQLALKKEMVEQGYMIGEFTPKNTLPGEYNKDFKPSQCPLPMLAIRSMTRKDLKFMHQDKDGALKEELVKLFSNRYGSSPEIEEILAEFK